MAVCARRTTLKNGSLHFADEGAIIIIFRRRGHGLLFLSTWCWYDWLPMSSLHVYLLTMAMYVFDCVYVWGAGHLWGAGRPYGQEVGDEGICGPGRRRTSKINHSGMSNAQQRGNKDTKSPNEICRPDFSSSSIVLAVMCRVRAQKHKIDKSRPQKSIN